MLFLRICLKFYPQSTVDFDFEYAINGAFVSNANEVMN